MEKTCRLLDLGCKEVINLSDGARLGFTRDVELDTESGQITALIIPGRLRCFGLLGREADTVVPWSAIERLGEDIIFIRQEGLSPRKGPQGRSLSVF